MTKVRLARRRRACGMALLALLEDVRPVSLTGYSPVARPRLSSKIRGAVTSRVCAVANELRLGRLPVSPVGSAAQAQTPGSQQSQVLRQTACWLQPRRGPTPKPHGKPMAGLPARLWGTPWAAFGPRKAMVCPDIPVEWHEKWHVRGAGTEYVETPPNTSSCVGRRYQQAGNGTRTHNPQLGKLMLYH